MFSRWILLSILSCIAVGTHGLDVIRQAHVQLNNGDFNGTITFTETPDGIRVTGVLYGHENGEFGLHIHELGNIITCYTTGAHFNPDNTDHGGRDHDVRHVGDLGNIDFVDGMASVNILDTVIALRGRNNILGRALVLHAERDDLGLGNDETSLITGNAGDRVACGVIGIASPADPWNSAITFGPSAALILLAAFIMHFFRI